MELFLTIALVGTDKFFWKINSLQADSINSLDDIDIISNLNFNLGAEDWNQPQENSLRIT